MKTKKETDVSNKIVCFGILIYVCLEDNSLFVTEEILYSIMAVSDQGS